MLESVTITRSPIDFRSGDSISVEGMAVRVDRVFALTANLVRVEGNVMSFPVSLVLGIGQMMRITRTVHVP